MQQANLDIPADVTATLVDPRAYADDRIHDAYRWLRTNNPLGIARPENIDPFWVVTRHADILNVGRQNDLFHNADRPPDRLRRARESSPARPIWCVRWCRWMRRITRNTAR